MFRSAPAPSNLITFSSATCIANGLWTIYWMGVAILSEIKCGPPHQACDDAILPILMYLLGEAFLFIPTMLGGVVLVALQTQRAFRWAEYAGLAGFAAAVGVPCATVVAMALIQQ